MIAIRQSRARSRKRPEADDGRDLQRRGDDGRVAGPAAGLGGEAQDAARVEPRGLAGREVVGQEHGRARPGRRRRPARAGAEELVEDPLLDVADVGGAGGQVRVGQALEPGGVAVEDLADGVLGGDPVALDPGPGVAAQGRVGDHPGVGGEDVGVLGAEPLPGLGLGGLGLDAGEFQAAVEPSGARRRRPRPRWRGGGAGGRAGRGPAAGRWRRRG